MENNNPNYYAIIPAYIRYDNRLNEQQKLMYGEITALSNSLGYCYATNKYFSKLYNKIPNTISRWINKLEECGYIRLEIIYDMETKRYSRKIYITDIKNRPIIKNDDRSIIINNDKAIIKNDENNIININSTSLNITCHEKKAYCENVKLTDEEYNNLILNFGEEKSKKAINELSLYKRSTGKQYNDDYATIQLWVIDRINKKENQISKLRNKNLDLDFDSYYDIGG